VRTFGAVQSSSPPAARGPAPRVLMVTPRFPPDMGGVERHVEEVASRIAAAGWDVTVLCTDRTGKRPRHEERGGFTVRRVRAWPAERDYHIAPGILREIARAHWDLVHVQSYHTFVAPLAMLAARSAGIPYVLTFHGGGHSSAVRASVRGVQRRVLRPLLRRAAALVAVARFEIDGYGAELGLGPEHFRLIPNGTDRAPGEPSEDFAEVPGTLIASVGRLERYKGHHRVLEALPHVLAARQDVRLRIAGTGPYEAALREKAARLGVADHVDIGAVEGPGAIAALMRRAALVILLSDFETHPLAVLEAVALGRPVLVADNSGMREIAEQGLATATAVDSPPEEVADAILAALAAPAPADEVQLPTWDDCAAGLLDLYASVTGKGAGVAVRAT
jgi:glycosyltransferase involved in cell wall biosynthesis